MKENDMVLYLIETDFGTINKTVQKRKQNKLFNCEKGTCCGAIRGTQKIRKSKYLEEETK